MTTEEAIAANRQLAAPRGEAGTWMISPEDGAGAIGAEGRGADRHEKGGGLAHRMSGWRTGGAGDRGDAAGVLVADSVACRDESAAR